MKKIGIEVFPIIIILDSQIMSEVEVGEEEVVDLALDGVEVGVEDVVVEVEVAGVGEGEEETLGLILNKTIILLKQEGFKKTIHSKLKRNQD